MKSRGYDVVIVGAGASGLPAAIAAARARASVAVCEHLDRAGEKLLASGGGRCNLARAESPVEIMSRFGREGRFLGQALAGMDAEGLRGFLAELDVPTRVESDGRVYPASDSAAKVLSALVRECERLDVEFRLRTRVKNLLIRDSELSGVVTERGEIVARCVIVASGGAGYPKLGATRDGYSLAAQAGHKIVEPAPALVPLLTKEKWMRRCSGIGVPNVRIRINLSGAAKSGVSGDLLFTHGGISGPAALDISGDVAERLRRHQGGVPLAVDLTPGVSSQEWAGRFDEWAENRGRKMMRSLLADVFPAALATELCRLAGLAEDVAVAHVKRPQRLALAAVITSLPLTVRATESWDRAMITRGGVALRDVDPGTLQSRLTPGVFFAGEVLDLDAPSGGYNLQWAFSSGWLAGASAAKAAMKPR